MKKLSLDDSSEDGPPPYQHHLVEDRLSFLSSRLSSILEGHVAAASTSSSTSTSIHNSDGGSYHLNANNSRVHSNLSTVVSIAANIGGSGANVTAPQSNDEILDSCNNNSASDNANSGSNDAISSIGKKSDLSSVSTTWLHTPESVERGGLECQKQLERRLFRRRIYETLEGWDRCDAVVINPLFHTGLPFRPRVVCVTNPFWRKGLVPDYTKISKKMGE